MRIRSIKPQFWQHRMHSRLSQLDALLALALLSYADDEGRFLADPGSIKSLLFTHRKVSEDEIRTSLRTLASDSINWIQLYQGKLDGIIEPIGSILTFTDHQFIQKPKKSRLPKPPRLPQRQPDSDDSATVPIPSEYNTGTVPGTIPELDPSDTPTLCVQVGLDGLDGGERKDEKERERERDRSPEEWVAAIVSAYPIRSQQRDCENLVMEALGSCDPKKMLAGTQAIAAVIGSHPSKNRHPFLPSPKTFFEGHRWDDDPAEFRRILFKNQTQAPDSPNAAPNTKASAWNLKQRLEALTESIKDHPANPDSSAYLGADSVSVALTEALRKLRKEANEIRQQIRQ